MKRCATVLGAAIAASLFAIGTIWSQDPTLFGTDQIRPSAKAKVDPPKAEPAASPKPAAFVAPAPGVGPVVPFQVELPGRADTESSPQVPTLGPVPQDPWVSQPFETPRSTLPGRTAHARLPELQRLANELRIASEQNAPGEEAKKAVKKLEAAVSDIFERDMADREQNLARIEQRVKNLRAQLDRRRKAKSEIVQLEVKVLANEAAGLGFYGLPSPQAAKRGRGFIGGGLVPESIAPAAQ